jgi:hypothetical protein
MATPGPEVELLAGGVETRSLDRGNWSQNVWRPSNEQGLQVRKGFGQIAQIDSTLADYSGVTGTLAIPSDTVSGYKEHLGSFSFETDFGTTQILSVFSIRGTTGEGVSSSAHGKWGTYYSVSIFDVDTRALWEDVIHRHTSENKISAGGMATPSFWFGTYETNESRDVQNFTAGLDSPFFFHEFERTVFFGNKFTGVLAYFPVDIRKTRSRAVESCQRNDWVSGYSESAVVTRVVPVDGIFPVKHNYLNASEISATVAITSLQNSIVLAGESQIWFSEARVLNAFTDDSFLTIPSGNDITAVCSLMDNLIVFTASETFLYRPSAGDNLSGGVFTTLSRSIGCIGPSALHSSGSTAFWVSERGIYTLGEGFRINELSAPISDFFKGGTTSPLAHYLTASGLSDPVTNEQPRTLYRRSIKDKVTIAYWEEQSALIVSFSENNAAWVFSGGSWSIWPFESSVTSNNSVGVTKNISSPAIMESGNRLFLCGSLDSGSVTNDIDDKLFTRHSFYLLEYGVGGALDRSVKDEDNRETIGYWKLVHGSATTQTRFYVGKPALDSVSGKYQIPIDLVTDAATNDPDNFRLYFDWKDSCFTFDAGGKVPTERLGNYGAFSAVIIPNAGDDTFQLTKTAMFATKMKTAIGQRNPLYILTGVPVSGPGKNIWGYGMSNLTAEVDVGAITTSAAVYVWQQFYGEKPTDATIAQPVDWAYKGQQVEESSGQIQSRGLFSVMSSHGSATSKLSPTWVWGVYNTLLGSDWKDWSSQVIDYSGGNIEHVVDKLTVRSRVQDSAGDMKLRKFNGAPKYGEFLIDDEEMDTIATSDSTRGQRISYMLFGFIQNKAESLRLSSVKMSVRTRKGTRRRWGR